MNRDWEKKSINKRKGNWIFVSLIRYTKVFLVNLTATFCPPGITWLQRNLFTYELAFWDPFASYAFSRTSSNDRSSRPMKEKKLWRHHELLKINISTPFQNKHHVFKSFTSSKNIGSWKIYGFLTQSSKFVLEKNEVKMKFQETKLIFDVICL